MVELIRSGGSQGRSRVAQWPASRDGVRVRRSKKLSVTVDKGVLTLQGQRKGKDHGRKVHRIERDHGRFGRSFALPNLVDDAHVKAEFRNGVLHLGAAQVGKSQTESDRGPSRVRRAHPHPGIASARSGPSLTGDGPFVYQASRVNEADGITTMGTRWKEMNRASACVVMRQAGRAVNEVRPWYSLVSIPNTKGSDVEAVLCLSSVC